MQSLMTDEPPVLAIGTDVSAKYKGAFCEAKIKKITRNVKCKLTVKNSNNSLTADDYLITGTLRVGSQVVVKHNSQQLEAVINKILDQSFYTVVFDDGDEATLKRSSLCLKSGKHFAESETLDQMPLTNPEHFGNPVSLDDSDDEQTEEKDRFVAQLYKYMDERGTPINRAPSVGGKDLNLYKLYRIVVKMGGYNRVTNKNSWRNVYKNLGLPSTNNSGKDSAAVLQLKGAYKKYLHSFDDFYRKLGCTITVNSRTSRPSRGERLREERPSKKNAKKETKKDDMKEDSKDSNSNESSEMAPRPPKDKDKEKEKEKEKEEKEETKVKESKDDVKVKIEDNPTDERKHRGRGRKKRDDVSDEPPGDEDTMTGQSTIDDSDEDDPKSSKVDESLIKVGDSLKVKYGRGRQQKLYEAKVLKIEVDSASNRNKYFVHYSGWNSRYDEWIKKSRIVQLLRDRSPRRRSSKLKNKRDASHDVSTTAPNNQCQVSVITSMSSQNSVSSVNSNDDSSRHSSQSQPKRGRPPNSGKNVSVKDVKEEPKEKSSQEKQSPQSQTSDTKGGRRGRPPLSTKKEKLTRSKSITDDQSTNDSLATSSLADESKIDEKKTTANISSDNEVSDKNDETDMSEEVVIAKKTVQPPELHDENTVENKLTYEEPVHRAVSPVAIKSEPIEQAIIKSVVTDVVDGASAVGQTKEQTHVKEETKSVTVQDAFDFVDEELPKEEEPLKEQLKKKRKSKDDGKKANKNGAQTEKTEKSKEIVNEDNEVRDNVRSNSFSRKSAKKPRKASIEPVDKNDDSSKEMPVLTDETLPPVLQKEAPVKPEEVEVKATYKSKTEAKSPQSGGESTTQKEPKHKRKGRKRKEEEITTPVRKKVKPSKLELHEEDSSLEVQKLFEAYSCSTPPQESDISPVEEMKVLPQFTNDINPSQQESVSSDFLLCEEAVPASPEKAPQPDEQMDDSLPAHESPHSYHSSPTRSPVDHSVHKDGKGSGGSNSELENEPMVSTKEDNNKMESFPSPTHDEDSMISRLDCNKSPVSPKKRRRGRVRTISQSDGNHSKERIGCKTRGSSGRHRAERHSPLTALEHRMPFSLTPISFDNFVPESKYNFCKPLDDSIDADKRIHILQERLQELRKTYMNIKQEVAVLERKKKKARRKDKERKDMNSNHRHQTIHNNVDHINRIVSSVPSTPTSGTSPTTT